MSDELEKPTYDLWLERNLPKGWCEMTDKQTQYRRALTQIHDITSRALFEDSAPDESGDPHHEMTPLVGCMIKTLPRELHLDAAAQAVHINPLNSPFAGAPGAALADELTDPQRIAVLTKKCWAPRPRTLSVSFLESTPSALRAKIMSHLNAWAVSSCIDFAETNGIGEVRISRGAGGYWSYLGTDILMVPQDQPTMNLEAFSLEETPDSEFYRVVRHETGHTLGCPHEHMRRALVARIDRSKAYQYFLETQGWDRKTVDQQVLTPLEEKSLMGTPADQTSIMCYQLPASITKDSKPILGGVDINRSDYQFVAKIYPRTSRTTNRETAEAEAHLLGIQHAF